MKKFFRLTIFSVLALFSTVYFTACSYSFTGSSVPEHLHNILIHGFKDKTHSGEGNVAELLTNLILENFITDNSLTVIDKGKADSELSGSIVSIKDRMETVTGETITQRKVTVKVKAVYRDNVKKKKVFDKTFSAFATYDNNADDVVQARSEAIATALKQIADDILMAVVARW